MIIGYIRGFETVQNHDLQFDALKKQVPGIDHEKFRMFENILDTKPSQYYNLLPQNFVTKNS